MLRLEFTEVDVKLLDFNPRVELHGEDRKLAGDLQCEAACTADVLAHFNPDLRALLFNKDSLDLANGEAVRLPKLKALKWDDEMTGATFSLHHGIGAPTVFGDVSVNQFRIEPRNGGTVMLAFRVQLHPEEAQAGQLAALIQSTINVSVAPAELPTMAEAA